MQTKPAVIKATITKKPGMVVATDVKAGGRNRGYDY